MRANEFIIENLPNHTFSGFTFDENWNGWDCPYFTFEQAPKILLAENTAGINAHYDKSSDSFIFEFDGEKEIYSATEFNSEKLYGIGSHSWIWEELNN